MKQQPEKTFPRPVPGPTDALELRRYMLEPSPRRVRVKLGGEFIADSTDTQLMFETGKLPVYYFPKRDVRMELLVDSGREILDEVKGRIAIVSLELGGMVTDEAAGQAAVLTVMYERGDWELTTLRIKARGGKIAEAEVAYRNALGLFESAP